MDMGSRQAERQHRARPGDTAGRSGPHAGTFCQLQAAIHQPTHKVESLTALWWRQQPDMLCRQARCTGTAAFSGSALLNRRAGQAGAQ